MRGTKRKKGVFNCWKFIVWILLLAWIVLVNLACERRELTYYEAAEVTITLDWGEAGLPATEAAHGATALFYPVEGGKPKIVLMGSRESAKTRLAVGHYHVVVFNRSFDDFGGIAFRGIDRYETAEAYLKEAETRAEGSRVVVESPEAFAIGRLADFEVTEEMLGNYNPSAVGKREVTDVAVRSVLHLVPQPATREVALRLDIPGLHNIRSAVGRIDALPQAMKLATGEISAPEITQQFTFTERAYDSGSLTDGYLKGSFISFGWTPTVLHTFHLKALLVDGKTIFEQTFEQVTIEEIQGEDGEVLIEVKIDTPTKPVPDVKPEGGVDSGFDATVDDWGDEEESDILI